MNRRKLCSYGSRAERQTVPQEETKFGMNVTICKKQIRHSESVMQKSSLKKEVNSYCCMTVQVVAGFRYKLQFAIEKSNCTRTEFKVVTEECHPSQEKTILQCNSTVDVAPWRHEVPEVHVECMTVTKSGGRFKRPPGWTPLRIMPIRKFTSKTKVKESSEESKESIGKTPHTPLNCPTKPWKEFKPVVVTTAPPTTTEPSQPDPTTANAVFSDLDLLT
ncbi:T-kininogen 1-like protein [Labeo rohita]|uniref:T-kininogen 1-like protein n=1 Tax=Labeo rohita TaxID=84645 RepID=A0A498MUT8_LABRO|nr:T-kininogen 1-like protein [Labeo rohita]